MSVVLSKSGHSATLKRCSSKSKATTDAADSAAPRATGSFFTKMKKRVGSPGVPWNQVTSVTPNNARPHNGAAEKLVQSLDEKIVALMNQASQDEAQEQQSKTLNKFIGVVIVINTVMMGFELDFGPGMHVPIRDRLFWFCMESFFIVVFIIELFIRLWRGRTSWISSPWNWLDFVVVVTAVLESWVFSVASGRSSLKVVTLLRIVRLIRLVRVLKLLRMFRGLYMTLNAFREAMGSMGYLGAVLITGLYVCSIFTTATIGHSEKLKHIQMGSVTAEDRFGTIPRSMYSLFELMTLEGWDLVGRPLVEVEPLFSIFLGMFIMVFTFGLLNMIVAFVVEKTMKQARLMGELNHHESLKEVAEGILQMKTIFEESDADGSGVISKREFQEALLNNEKVQECFEKAGIPTHDAETLYAVLDADGSGTLTFEELIDGCARIRGASNPEWDLLAMHSLLRSLARQVNKVRRDQKALQQNSMPACHSRAAGSASSFRSESSSEVPLFPGASSLGSLPDMKAATSSQGSLPEIKTSGVEQELRTVIAQQDELIKRQQCTLQRLEQEAREQSEECAQLLRKLEMHRKSLGNQSPSADEAAGTACSAEAHHAVAASRPSDVTDVGQSSQSSQARCSNSEVIS